MPKITISPKVVACTRVYKQRRWVCRETPHEPEEMAHTHTVETPPPGVRFPRGATAWAGTRVDGRDCAFFSSWPGVGGIGEVEDLFTVPASRHRGLATALIGHAVDDARRWGAGPVLMGAVADDTPKSMHAALGSGCSTGVRARG